MHAIMRGAVVLLLLSGAATGQPAASGRIEAAIALYHEARYTDALAALDEAEAGSSGTRVADDERDAVDLYRALSLLALDRGPEARSAVRRLIERRPDHQFQEGELPPRFMAMVREAQAEIVPAVVRSEYRAGKASYDQGAYEEAEARLRRAASLAEARSVPPEARESLSDLVTVARGFLGLIESRRAAAAATPLPDVRPAAVVPTPSGPFSAADRGVTPPVTLRQDLPAWRSEAAGSALFGRSLKARLEVVIDETGRVQAARLVNPLHPLYDSKLLAAARRWEYRPATRNGSPVRFRKVLDVVLDGTRQ